MLITTRAPVVWPNRAALDRWWRERDDWAELEAIELDASGIVIWEEGDPEEMDVRLVRGTHLRPGAAYSVTSPSLDGVSIDVGIDGTPQRRGATLEIAAGRGVLSRRSRTLLEATLQGLDGLDAVRVMSRHPYVRGSLILLPDPEKPLDLEIRLRWLRVTATARVREARPGDGTELVVRTSLTSRGLWTPAIAPVIAILGRFIRRAVRDGVQELAANLTALAEGREFPSALADRERERVTKDVLYARGLLRKRLDQVHADTSSLGWWSSRGGAFRRSYRDLPPAHWPERDPQFGTWEEEASGVVDQVSRTARGLRAETIEQRIGWFGNGYLHANELYLPIGEPDDENPPVSGVPMPPPPVLRAEDLELAWLRSPRTTLAYVRTQMKAEALALEDLIEEDLS